MPSSLHDPRTGRHDAATLVRALHQGFLEFEEGVESVLLRSNQAAELYRKPRATTGKRRSADSSNQNAQGIVERLRAAYRPAPASSVVQVSSEEEFRTMIRISVANLRRSLAEMLSRVRFANQIVIVLSHQRPWAVIIPFDQAERLGIVQKPE